MANTGDAVRYMSMQLESVTPIIAKVFQTSNQVAARVKKAKDFTHVSRYLYRFPLMLYPGGTDYKFNKNGGVTIAYGTAPSFTSLSAAYVTTMKSFAITEEAIEVSMSGSQTVYTDPVEKIMATAMEEIQVADDIDFHQDGSGVLTNASSAVTATTMTFATAGDYVGVTRLREGMAADVWTVVGSTGTKRVVATALPLIIESISGKTITFNQTVTGITAGDVVARMGMDAYGPAYCDTGTSTYPTAPGSQTAGGGIGGDSYRHGLYYAHNAGTSTYYYGKLKSSYPKLVVQRVTTTSPTPLSFAHGWVGFDRIAQLRDADVANNLLGLFPFSQRRQTWSLGVAIATRTLTSEQFGKNVDITPSNNKPNDEFNFADHACIVDIRQQRDRVDFIDVSRNWGRVVLFDTRPYKGQDGKLMFQDFNSSALRTSTWEFGYESGYDWICYDPGAELMIDNLSVDENV